MLRIQSIKKFITDMQKQRIQFNLSVEKMKNMAGHVFEKSKPTCKPNFSCVKNVFEDRSKCNKDIV